MGADDESYTCVFQQEDDVGIKGIKLDKVRCQKRPFDSFVEPALRSVWCVILQSIPDKPC